MEQWWQSISTAHKIFTSGAMFFTGLLIWQLISTVMGLDHHQSMGEAHHGFEGASHAHDSDHSPHSDQGISFSLVSLRSILAFGTMFCWAGTMYQSGGTGLALTLVYSSLWGFAGMLSVAYLVYRMLHLQEYGNQQLWKSIGEPGEVYVTIPLNDTGQVRVHLSGTVSYVKAKTPDGREVKAGTAIRVVGVFGDDVLIVEPETLVP